MTTIAALTATPAPLIHSSSELSLGEYAYGIVQRQVCRLKKLEKQVLTDEDPEALHDFRVVLRRLGTALTIFGPVLEVPEKAGLTPVKKICKILGCLRDLDVQMVELQETYRPQVDPAEQALLDRAVKILKKLRTQAFAETAATLSSTRYRKLKAAWKTWLAQPCYGPLAQLPLASVVPDLLSPLLSRLLLHPGWLVTQAEATQADDRAAILHDLRKTCKQVRYQLEFFVDLYPKALQGWVNQVKALQDQLGALHDAQVLAQVLRAIAPNAEGLRTVQELLHVSQQKTLADWDRLRQTYLVPETRSQLRQLVLTLQMPPLATQSASLAKDDRQPSKDLSALEEANEPPTDPEPSDLEISLPES